MEEGTSSGPCPDRICLPSPAQALSFEVVVKSRGLPVVIGERNRVAAQRELLFFGSERLVNRPETNHARDKRIEGIIGDV